MSLNFPFAVELAGRYSPPPGRLLDFGCGKADVAALALAQGYDAYGVDTFLGVGDSADNLEIARESIGDRVRTMRPDEPIPFDSGTFDVVVSNQVFEHIRDLAPTIDELARILRQGGTLIALMPTREVLWEDHLKMPLVHLASLGSERQRLLMSTMYRLGFGRGRERPEGIWIEDAIADIGANIFHRTAPDYIEQLSRKFRIQSEAEPAWARYRIERHRLLGRAAPLAAFRGLDGILRYVVRRAAGSVLVLQRL
ncbi:MAG: class I SAM-dependent methyltransferase [Hyphomicrobium sp.]|jgi:SAM-dependent methyltransferase